eukprot:TRINITY_DN5739_c0_g2_i1.p1 TRINITY_DN5739_c0_g2~~TRINITY_DN5739_c0_g2_i1.p1  ORF type:complete len:172 (-),score=33.98 TRINITY_DN5739_c0_g2_i1:443-958(-)
MINSTLSSLAIHPSSVPPILVPIPLVYFKPRIIFPMAQEGSSSEMGVGVGTEKVAAEEQLQDSKEGQDERRGLWSEEEHKKFLEAMDLYGNDWPSVVKFIGTRTANQVRSHAQKFYRKIKRRAIKKVKAEGGNQKKVFVIIQWYRNKLFVPKGYSKKADSSIPTTSLKKDE